MCVQRTRTKQLRPPLTTTLRASKKYAVQFQLSLFNYKSDYTLNTPHFFHNQSHQAALEIHLYVFLYTLNSTHELLNVT